MVEVDSGSTREEIEEVFSRKVGNPARGVSKKVVGKKSVEKVITVDDIVEELVSGGLDKKLVRQELGWDEGFVVKVPREIEKQVESLRELKSFKKELKGTAVDVHKKVAQIPERHRKSGIFEKVIGGLKEGLVGSWRSVEHSEEELKKKLIGSWKKHFGDKEVDLPRSTVEESLKHSKRSSKEKVETFDDLIQEIVSDDVEVISSGDFGKSKEKIRSQLLKEKAKVKKLSASALFMTKNISKRHDVLVESGVSADLKKSEVEKGSRKMIRAAEKEEERKAKMEKARKEREEERKANIEKIGKEREMKIEKVKKEREAKIEKIRKEREMKIEKARREREAKMEKVRKEREIEMEKARKEREIEMEKVRKETEIEVEKVRKEKEKIGEERMKKREKVEEERMEKRDRAEKEKMEKVVKKREAEAKKMEKIMIDREIEAEKEKVRKEIRKQEKKREGEIRRKERKKKEIEADVKVADLFVDDGVSADLNKKDVGEVFEKIKKDRDEDVRVANLLVEKGVNADFNKKDIETVFSEERKIREKEKERDASREKVRLKKEKVEKARLEKVRLVKEKKDKERDASREKVRKVKEKVEKARLEKVRLVKEKKDKERDALREKARLVKEKKDKERDALREKARKVKEKKDKERDALREKARKVKEKVEKVRLEKVRIEKEKRDKVRMKKVEKIEKKKRKKVDRINKRMDREMERLRKDKDKILRISGVEKVKESAGSEVLKDKEGETVVGIKSESPVVIGKRKEVLAKENLVEEKLVAGKTAVTVKSEKPEVAGKKAKIDVGKIAQDIMDEQIKKQRGIVKKTLDGATEKKKKTSREYVKTGIEGFDALLNEGIPKGSTVLVAGGAGCGKTIFCLQTLANQAKAGKKCLYMSFEEKPDNLVQHMDDLGFEPRKLMKAGNLKIQRTNPFDITRNVDAMLAKQKGELLIDIDPVIIPRDFKPDFIFLDSLTAIASAFTGKEESYRIYIEQLFRFFEKIGATSFLITETEQIPKIFSKSGVEEFLADGVIVMYNLKQRNVRENAIEILKLRGVGHEKKIVALQITSKGIVIYPEQEVFSEMD